VTELYQEAVKHAKANRVEKAAEAYMKVRTYYPGNDLAKQSLIELGDLYFNNKEYESALTSYQEFRMLYPTDAKAEYCFFRSAMCHSMQILSFDRDQTQTANAMRAFDDFLRLYPNSTYKNEAQQKLKDARLSMAKHNLAIGKFYQKAKKFEAACKRYQFVKANFSGIGLDEELDKLMAQTCNKK
jgi:outer membrane protein assembly factor BamD